MGPSGAGKSTLCISLAAWIVRRKAQYAVVGLSWRISMTVHWPTFAIGALGLCFSFIIFCPNFLRWKIP